MNTIKDYTLKGADGKIISLDVCWNASDKPKPLVVFAHGFKGFKDWGHWHMIAQSFANQGFCFVKFNFSHNGVRPDDLLNFCDLEAFGHNNFEKELYDLKTVLNWLESDQKTALQCQWDAQNITLIGHSRGGPIVLLEGTQRASVKKVITWAAVHELDYAWHYNQELTTTWQEEGVRYIMNGRTKQSMPLYYQLYENYNKHKSEFSVRAALKLNTKPYLIIHGSEDPAVPVTAAQYLFQHAKHATIHIIEGANHVFGGQHPYLHEQLPEHAIELVDKSGQFIKTGKL